MVLTYTSPLLTEFGAVSELTHGNSGAGTDASNSKAPNPNKPPA